MESIRGRPKKRGADSGTITLTISKEDKRRMKAYALERDVSMSDLLHDWITDFCPAGNQSIPVRSDTN